MAVVVAVAVGIVVRIRLDLILSGLVPMVVKMARLEMELIPRQAAMAGREQLS